MMTLFINNDYNFSYNEVIVNIKSYLVDKLKYNQCKKLPAS